MSNDRMPIENHKLLNWMKDKERNKNDLKVQIKGLVVMPFNGDYNTYEAVVHIPSLTVEMDEKSIDFIHENQRKAEYKRVIFMVLGNPIEVPIIIRDNKKCYVCASSIAKLDLEEMPYFKENNNVKKKLEIQQRVKQAAVK